jgi:D-alanyl-D-alanine carboxypeptidase/D-alanyl-D-alanine-endopeptidase (penicillin-binding protein 4)
MRMRMLAAGAAAAMVVSLVPGLASAVTPSAQITAQLRTVRPHASPFSANARIARLLSIRTTNPALGPDLAVRVIDPGTGRTVYGRNSMEGQLPASNAKIITSFAALRVMGPNARRMTRVVKSGRPGTIVLIGDGDPMLTSSKLDLLAARTAKAWAASFPVSPLPPPVAVEYDDSLFPAFTRPSGWRSDYVPSEVNPVSPLMRYGVRTSRPTLDAVRYFVSRLRAHGVVAVVSKHVARTSGPSLAFVTGYTVLGCIKRMLAVSDNNIAEVLFRDTALAAGRSGSWADARATANAVLRSFGIPMTGVSVIDGSGMSRAYVVPARVLAILLARAMTASDQRVGLFLSALPVSGLTGTLAARYHRYDTAPTKCAVGLIEAKTGFLTGVYSLSGVAIAADGRPRTFSLLANHVSTSKYTGLQVRRALDALAATVTGCY